MKNDQTKITQQRYTSRYQHVTENSVRFTCVIEKDAYDRLIRMADSKGVRRNKMLNRLIQSCKS